MRVALVLVAALAVSVLGSARGIAAEMILVGPDGSAGPDGLPPGWQPALVKKGASKTRYQMLRVAGADVLEAESQASASALYRPLDVDARTYRVIAWRWKVQHALVKADARRPDAHDHAARVYVAFRHDPTRASFWERATRWGHRLWYGEYPLHGVLHYAWDNRLPRGTVLAVPGRRNEKIIVLRSGEEDVGRWVAEERNVHEDFQRAFGVAPSHIAGIGVMTDTDDAGERAMAWYHQIVLRPGG
jgi:Protein of unknown function (DUF3047)